MAITLIVTKSLNEEFEETGEQIDFEQWLKLVQADPALTLRNQPYTTKLPDGHELTIPVLPGHAELTVSDGEPLPFLGYRKGELVMQWAEEMEQTTNPTRRKIAEVARRLGALIKHDAGDEILKW